VENCPSCDAKDRLIEFLNQQLERSQSRQDLLTEHVVNLADQTALARLRGPAPRANAGESAMPPVRSQGALRLRRDIMTPADIQAVSNVVDPAGDTPRESVESQFVLPSES
jgi:hypothetical protein